MKELDLTEAIRKKAWWERRFGSQVPHLRTNTKWPMCGICLKEVDSVKLENVNNKSCEIRAEHHGAEDSLRVVWTVPVQAVGNDILEDPNVGWCIKRAMADSLFFRPEHLESHAKKA